MATPDKDAVAIRGQLLAEELQWEPARRPPYRDRSVQRPDDPLTNAMEVVDKLNVGGYGIKVIRGYRAYAEPGERYERELRMLRDETQLLRDEAQLLVAELRARIAEVKAFGSSVSARPSLAEHYKHKLHETFDVRDEQVFDVLAVLGTAAVGVLINAAERLQGELHPKKLALWSTPNMVYVGVVTDADVDTAHKALANAERSWWVKMRGNFIHICIILEFE
jgi:hypothetical protein